MKAAAHTLGVVQRTLHAAPQACRNTAYQTLVRLKLEYASTAWSPQTPGKICKLESIQNKAARFVTHKYDCTSSVTGLKMSLNYHNPGYGLSLVDTLWNAGSYRQPLEQEGNPMT